MAPRHLSLALLISGSQRLRSFFADRPAAVAATLNHHVHLHA